MRMIVGHEGFASLAFLAVGSHRVRYAASADDPREPVRAFRRTLHRRSHLFASARFHGRRGGRVAQKSARGRCKSLFLKDKIRWVLARRHARGAPRRSEEACRTIGLAALFVRRRRGPLPYARRAPGSVTPFALVNDVERFVTPVLDAAMLECDPLNYHPLANNAQPQSHRMIYALHCRRGTRAALSNSAISGASLQQAEAELTRIFRC